MRFHWIVVASLVLGTASPALAQGTYVSASLTGDIVRFSRSETPGVRGLSGGGEATGFALRVGTSLGPIWGVEAEFARPSEIDNDGATDVIPLAYQTLASLSEVTANVMAGLPNSLVYPPFPYQVRTSQRNTTFSTGVWARQALSARAALVYSGGVGFHRTETDVEFTYGPGRGSPMIPIIIPPRSLTDTITYSARPFAGIEARIGMNDHAEFVLGVRLHGLRDGMLVRPAVGLGWRF
jgi:hypothetical protein